MSRFTAFDPGTEINGRTASALLVNINHSAIAGILKDQGFEDIQPDMWYPLQRVLDVLRAISEGENASNNLIAIGVAAGKLGAENLPPQMRNLSLGEFLVEYGKIYLLRHRNGDVGYVRTEMVDDSHVILQTRMPYPDDIGYGIFYAYARHFCPPNKYFSIHYDSSTPRRDEGGMETIYHIYITD